MTWGLFLSVCSRVCVEQTVLSGDVYTSLSFLVDMMNVSLELLDSPKSTGHKQSLARCVTFTFMLF